MLAAVAVMCWAEAAAECVCVDRTGQEGSELQCEPRDGPGVHARTLCFPPEGGEVCRGGCVEVQ